MSGLPDVASAEENVSTSGASDAEATGETWPLPRRLRDHLTLDTPKATALYWAGLALMACAVFIPKLLPCVDYPQHLALSDVMRRLADPNSPAHSMYQVNYFTYNGLFHLLTARMSAFIPIDVAGRIVVATSLVGLGGAVLALVRVMRRPPAYAALFTPIVFSFSVGWGFVNYALATAIAVTALVIVARLLVRPTVVGVLALAAIGLLCAFAHVLAMLFLCLAAASLAPELAWRHTRRSGEKKGAHVWRSFLRSTIALAPLLVGCLFCLRVYQLQYVWDPGMYRDPAVEGIAPPIWQKIGIFGAYATDLHSDRTDQVLVIGAVFLMAGIAYWVYRARKRGEAIPQGEPRERPVYGPFIALALAYLATPMVLIGTHLIFPRLAQGVILGAILATPVLTGAAARRVRTIALTLGVAAGANLVLHSTMFAYETNDARRVIDDLPRGRAAAAVIYDPGSFAFRNGSLVHLSAYYGAIKEGTWSFSFARYLSVPVRFRPNTQPAWPARGWEFEGRDYNPRCKYARVYDLVIIKAPGYVSEEARGEGDVRRLVFGKDKDAVTLLSHHGRYWAFDTKGLPDDGTY